MFNGYKTYLLVILALISGLSLYIAEVVSNGFSVNGLITFINSEAMVAALGTMRLALGKK